MHSSRVVLAMLAAMLLAGCAADRTARLDHVVGASCPKGPQPDLSLPRQSLPDDFVPVQVIRCHWDSRYLPGKGRWEVVIEEHANGPVDELMSELRRPSERSMFGRNCLMIEILVDYFVVVDSAGRVVLPDLPTGLCGGPFSSTLDALRGLPYRVDEQIPIRRIESEKAFRAGCGDKYTDVILTFSRLRAGTTQSQQARPMWNPAPKGLRVCAYRTLDKTAGSVEGKLESVRILKGGNLRNLLTALDSTPATDCPSDHTRFAVLSTGSREAYAELDGCHNLMRPDGTFGRLTPDAVRLLAD
ncbi:hypothetical protein SAMN05216276_100753 [Streptosporangium subroseum]|uniref:Lipoprotein n=1 Tax=Streptosporangium subroseum TaxID=106412 RepID=A0A239DBG5_9ACTN|nr:hypothetical protein [Streptosporangium subroseum]SNS29705.1 hypothetical protein SAMN05216276_100753 [Streptosporangium subroseum]